MPLLSTPSDTRSQTSVLLAENACDENPVLARVVVLSALRSSTFMRVLALALPFAWTPARGREQERLLADRDGQGGREGGAAGAADARAAAVCRVAGAGEPGRVQAVHLFGV